MQHGYGFGQPDFLTTAMPVDSVFGYPFSPPAAGPGSSNARWAWDVDSAMAGMDMEFARAIMPNLDTAWTDQVIFADVSLAPIPDIFGGATADERAVPAGLLLTQPQALCWEATGPPPGPCLPLPGSSTPSSAPSVVCANQTGPSLPTGPGPGPGPSPNPIPTFGLSSVPMRPAGRRPVPSRGLSGRGGKKTLPRLAPAPRRPEPQGASVCHWPSLPARHSTTPRKPGGHGRPSGLSSTPEAGYSPPTRTRTQARFSIDAHGRARVETTLIVEPDCSEAEAAGTDRVSWTSRPRSQDAARELRKMRDGGQRKDSGRAPGGTVHAATAAAYMSPLAYKSFTMLG